MIAIMKTMGFWKFAFIGAILFSGVTCFAQEGGAASTPGQAAIPASTATSAPQPPASESSPSSGASGQSASAPSASHPAPTQPSTSAANGQQSSTQDDESVTTIRKTVNEVNVVFTVTDKHGRYVKDLKKDDFKFIDDSKPAAEVKDFRNQTDLPLQVGLLIDASNSIRDRFKFEQESAIEFLNQTIRPRYDEAFVVGFDVTPEVTQDFTDKTDALAQGVRALRPGGGTAMYDALYFACRDKLQKSPQASSVRRAIILVSDGEDNSSHVTREEAIEMALRANTIVYTISTNFPSGGIGDKVLQRIAEATGGRAFQPFQLTDVANAFTQIQDDLRSQYDLSYRPENFVHNGRYRPLAITALHKGLKVRSRSGYYAPVQ